MDRDASMAAAAGLLLGAAIRGAHLLERGLASDALLLLRAAADRALRLTVADADDVFVEAMLRGDWTPAPTGRPAAGPIE